MVSTEDKRLFLEVLNKGFRHKTITTWDEFIVIASLETRVMPPSKAKQVLNDVLKAGLVEKRGDYIRLDGLWNGHEYVIKSKTGKVIQSKSATTKNQPKRTVKYAGPGHTIVGYEHRTLHIHFKETKKEYEARAKARRSKAARGRTHNDSILVDRDESGNMVFVNKGGSNVGLRAKSRSDKGKNAIIKKKLAADDYTIEDMRALLRDDHWEEYCGNKRWNYDNKETVKQFRAYLRTRRH